jgi:hypothetical protein
MFHKLLDELLQLIRRKMQDKQVKDKVAQHLLLDHGHFEEEL